MEILKVEGVSKQIKNHRILDNINFSIFENEIVGLLDRMVLEKVQS